MVQEIIPPTTTEIIYPDSDGQPMADNTKQFRLIVTIKENLELLYADNPDVFIAGDLLWYPIQGDNKIRRAPDVMVVFGRPKGDRGSYKQWLENQISPQVVFEILSPGNTLKEMGEKLEFYEDYGVEEYYLYDPDTNNLSGWLREENRLRSIKNMQGWVSPRLNITFALNQNNLEIFTLTGQKFLTYTELGKLQQEAEQRAELEYQRAELEYQRAELEYQRAEQAEGREQMAVQLARQEQQRAEQAEARMRELEAKLRELGQITDI
ncbi:Uma2 family endonuclease [Aphanothece sacrum]|nr:Uma2 family endonuclease [Aphanothece sacrum]